MQSTYQLEWLSGHLAGLTTDLTTTVNFAIGHVFTPPGCTGQARITDRRLICGCPFTEAAIHSPACYEMAAPHQMMNAMLTREPYSQLAR